MGAKKKSEAVIKDIKRRTRRTFSSEEKIAIVLEGLRELDFRHNQYGGILPSYKRCQLSV